MKKEIEQLKQHVKALQEQVSLLIQVSGVSYVTTSDSSNTAYVNASTGIVTPVTIERTCTCPNCSHVFMG